MIWRFFPGNKAFDGLNDLIFFSLRSMRGSIAKVSSEQVTSSVNWISMKSTWQTVVSFVGTRKIWALSTGELNGDWHKTYNRLAGRTGMSFSSINRIPDGKSMFRISTTRHSNCRSCSSGVNAKRASATSWRELSIRLSCWLWSAGYFQTHYFCCWIPDHVSGCTAIYCKANVVNSIKCIYIWTWLIESCSRVFSSNSDSSSESSYIPMTWRVITIHFLSWVGWKAHLLK